ncbi:MAG: hypothetical protein ACU841_17515 [Gammaproteobacteria bacterium]
MKNVLVLIVLYGAMAEFAGGDPNIYGPGGVNLGPDGDLPKLREEIQQDRLLEEEREQTRLLQQQVQQLREIRQQQEELLRQREELLTNPQMPLRIEIQNVNPYSGGVGWIGGGQFCCGGVRKIPDRSRLHRRGTHPGRRLNRRAGPDRH